MKVSALVKIKLLTRPGIIAGIIVLISLSVSFMSYFSEKGAKSSTGHQYTYYNNYLIFKNSYQHLSENKNLYQPYVGEYYDLYKYSPTFAFLMAPFTWIPTLAGLLAWDLLNVLVLFFALWKIPFRLARDRLFAIAFIIIEMITSIQNHQSNGLIAGLIILGFMAMENRKTALASLLIVLTIFIKLFGIIALILFIFYPGKLKIAAYTLGWTVLLGIAPLILVPWDILVSQYRDWIQLIQVDSGTYDGLSVMSWLNTWFGLDFPGIYIRLTGLFFLLFPLIKVKMYPVTDYRLLFLASVLVWMVIFNHMAESPTFIIAVSGIAIWYFTRPFNRWNLFILIMVIVFTVLSPTDIFPPVIKKNFTEPYVVRVVPCILAWLKITHDMIRYRQEPGMAAGGISQSRSVI